MMLLLRWVGRNRRLVATLAIVGIFVLGLIGDQEIADRLAFTSFVALLIAVCLALVEIWILGDTINKDRAKPELGDKNLGWALGLLILLCVVASQTWFRAGTVIAVGDVAPPVGTEWLSRLFAPWTWSGSNLG